MTTEASEGAQEPTRSVEIERKYDVDADTRLPDWSSVPGVAATGEPEVRELDARYFDTSAGDLARARVALRRREGGPDAGWHVKVSDAEGRQEWWWPLDGDAAEEVRVPDAVAAAVGRWGDAPFVPLARVRNTRTAYALLDGDGGLIAEFVDDRVRARDERRGVETGWREWEMELGPAAPADEQWRTAFFAAVEQAVAAAGGRPAAADSKLGRTLTAGAS